VTIPDQIDQNWQNFEDALKAEVDRRITISSEKLKQTFTRYKKLMEKGLMLEKIRQLSFNESSVVATKVATPCDMQCVKICFTDVHYRFENVRSVVESCLVPTCNCTT